MSNCAGGLSCVCELPRGYALGGCATSSALTDVARYIEYHRGKRLESYRSRYETYLRLLRRFREITPESRILEVGTGPGWFPILCKLDGLSCAGLELSPELIEMARQTALAYGIEPDIEQGDLETFPLPENRYDAIVCSSVFEHVLDWRAGLRKVYRALKPGGALYFESTNKFSFTSGEYQKFPLYGWLPNACRYALRRRLQGEDIMRYGIDWHQFTHSGLRREFDRCGFRSICDRIELADREHISTGFRRSVVRAAGVPLAKQLALTFCEVTRFVCVR